MERRVLGRTGRQLSVIGFGGIVVSKVTVEEASRYVGEAVDAGINYFDVAPTYGNAEERLGPALEPYREQVFLACKTVKRKKDEAALELRQSLGRLKSDHLDLYQLHALKTDQDIEQAFGPGGVVEELDEAKQLGLIRHAGFSAHSEQAAVEALRRYPFDSVLFPFNYYAWNLWNFGPAVMRAAEQHGAGRLALKTLALGRMNQGESRPYEKCWYQPIDDPALAEAAVRWTLSQPITAAVTPGHIELLRLAIKSAANLAPPAPDQLELLARGAVNRKPVFPD